LSSIISFNITNDTFFMVDNSSSDNDTRSRLAANVRRLRVARHLSLSRLAQETSISKATLSAIERASGNPTIDTLTQLAGALRVSVAELLEGTRAGEMRIVRVSEAEPWPPPAGGRRALESNDELRGALRIGELALAPAEVHEPPPRASGSRTAVLVLRGKLIAGPVERISELASGDFASFPADAPHVYEAGRAAARALLIEYTPA
jgi:transcriptional regulator with XRE-family HTH domain